MSSLKLQLERRERQLTSSPSSRANCALIDVQLSLCLVNSSFKQALLATPFTTSAHEISNLKSS